MADPSEEHALGDAAPSGLFTAWQDALGEAIGLGPLADLACGRGRHALPSARLGWPTLAVDRNPVYLREVHESARNESLPLHCLQCDLESDQFLPINPETCGAILVFCFLYRPLARAIVEALAPGGLLLYQTFTLEQLSFSNGPRNPNFLLKQGELRALFPDLTPLDYREGARADIQPDDARPRAMAELVAVKPI